MQEKLININFEAKEIRNTLEQKACYPCSSLLKRISYSLGRPTFTPVEVEKIIGTMIDHDWHSFCGSDEYLEQYVHRVQSGKFDYEKDPPDLFEIDGIYFVSTNGRTRVAVAKFLGLPFINSRVERVIPNEVFVYSAEEYSEMEERRKVGQWDGEWVMNEDCGQSGYDAPEEVEMPGDQITSEVFGKWEPVPQPVHYAHALIKEYEGVWVFTGEPDLVKSLYQKVGVPEEK